MNIPEDRLKELYETGVKALAGDSNDDEHDALYEITGAIGELIGSDVDADRDRLAAKYESEEAL